MIGLRIAAKKRWRQRKKNKKCVENSLQLAGPSVSCQPCGKSPDAAEQQEEKPTTVQEKSPEPAQIPDKESKKPAATYLDKHHKQPIKETDPSEIARSEKTLGQGTFGVCYLAHYREILVAVKEFKQQESWSLEQMKREVFHEARMICHLGDHRGLPLLFVVVTESVPLRLVTQFHGMKRQSI